MGHSSAGADRLEVYRAAGESARLGTIPRGVRPAQQWGGGVSLGILVDPGLAQGYSQGTEVSGPPSEAAHSCGAAAQRQGLASRPVCCQIAVLMGKPCCGHVTIVVPASP